MPQFARHHILNVGDFSGNIRVNTLLYFQVIGDSQTFDAELLRLERIWNLNIDAIRILGLNPQDSHIIGIDLRVGDFQNTRSPVLKPDFDFQGGDVLKPIDQHGGK
ncbi:hypothetical protein SDC9_173462 [bioreactor metagenome]|uniref:Uncharacterized protein n=1 Tax=bioreactor metagenome TaxID=1076179 RepID=A0A645GIS7_9ZZZZ